MDTMRIIKRLPVCPLRNVVLFPGMTLHFDAGRTGVVDAIKKAGERGGELFVTLQRDPLVEEPAFADLCEFGVVAEVRQILRLGDKGNTLRVVVEGKQRARLIKLSGGSILDGQIETVPDDTTLPADAGDRAVFEAAAMVSVRRSFKKYLEFAENVTPDVALSAASARTPGTLADLIAANVQLPPWDKQILLEKINVFERLEELSLILAEEAEVLEVEEKLHRRVDELMDKNQREYYLREEMRAISEELGEDGDDASLLLEQIEKSAMPEEHKKKLKAEVDRMRRMPSTSPDYNVLRSYIEKCLEIPFGIYSRENKKLDRARRILERDHYGLKEVKERVTEMLAALIVSPELKGQILCLAGPPGVGKTSIAKSVAQATGRKYVRVALGGVHDEAEIRGHRRTYLGSMPGRIVAALIEAGTSNPLILLDEVDKLGNDYRGDPASALLEVLDAEQNFSFKDHYIDMPVDLSRVLFLTTANDKYAIPAPLLDRMEVIDLPGYTREEKLHIAKRHLIPKQLKQHGLDRSKLKITDAAVLALIDGYTREAGVRVLERKIAALCRKESVRLAEGNEEGLRVTDKDLETFLGPQKFRPDEAVKEDLVGVVNGLAWTSVGGELLKVEVLVMDGSGKLELTGSLGDVMKESARAAVSFIRSRAAALGVDPDFYKNKDIHIHFPEGAVPKDGPSAGVTVTSAVVSALTGRPARGDIAMTGEITLTGRVLPIGGLREKSMAAYREGIREVIIPALNVPDLHEVDEAVREKMTFYPVKTASEVLELVLRPAETPAPAKKEAEKKKGAVPKRPGRRVRDELR